jgi:hypothetical protein
LIIIGGVQNDISEDVLNYVYDSKTNEWFKIGKFDRFRHAISINDNILYSYGGFDENYPNTSKKDLNETDLLKIFSMEPKLKNALEKIFKQNGSFSSSSNPINLDSKDLFPNNLNDNIIEIKEFK